ncbi:sensor histidine kinase [Angustibacter sp. McL0619]|uniref:sensor histidine kinase n=1 Tax=Angustibacter sp. McL0619 TaxID=3415676 RepID=UPI003CE9ED9E
MEWLRTLARSRWTVPGLLVAFSQWEVWISGPTNLVGPRWAASATLGAASIVLAGRRRAPLTTQLAAAAITSVPWLVWGSSQAGSSFFIGVISTYAVGRWGRRPPAYLGIPIAAAWALLQIVRDPLQAGASAGWGWVLYAVISWVAGAWVRQNAELQNRRDGERANLSRAELAEQRLGIARDLHDVLANSLAVMVVHAEAAEEVLTADPARAAKALHRIQTAGRDALREVRSLLAPLRAAGEGDSTADAPTQVTTPEHPRPEPRAGLLDIDTLVDRMRDAGLPLEVSRRERRGVPPQVGEAIYRVLQESLSNTVRHAGLVETHVHLDVEAQAITIGIEDDGPAGTQPSVDGGGNGLPGMRERVERLGGTLQVASRPEGGFAVRATVPLDEPDADALAHSRQRRSPTSTELPR